MTLDTGSYRCYCWEAFSLFKAERMEVDGSGVTIGSNRCLQSSLFCGFLVFNLNSRIYGGGNVSLKHIHKIFTVLRVKLAHCKRR